jgi:hypothetical protein
MGVRSGLFKAQRHNPNPACAQAEAARRTSLPRAHPKTTSSRGGDGLVPTQVAETQGIPGTRPSPPGHPCRKGDSSAYDANDRESTFLGSNSPKFATFVDALPRCFPRAVFSASPDCETTDLERCSPCSCSRFCTGGAAQGWVPGAALSFFQSGFICHRGFIVPPWASWWDGN